MNFDTAKRVPFKKRDAFHKMRQCANELNQQTLLQTFQSQSILQPPIKHWRLVIHATSSQHTFVCSLRVCIYHVYPQIKNNGTPFIPKGLVRLISGQMKRVPFRKKDSFSFWASANPASHMKHYQHTCALNVRNQCSGSSDAKDQEGG